LHSPFALCLSDNTLSSHFVVALTFTLLRVLIDRFFSNKIIAHLYRCKRKLEIIDRLKEEVINGIPNQIKSKLMA
jgi:hypothetical protein